MLRRLSVENYALIDKLERQPAGIGYGTRNLHDPLGLRTVLPAEGLRTAADENIGLIVLQDAPEGTRQACDLGRRQDLDRHGDPARSIGCRNADTDLADIKSERDHRL